MPAITSVGSAAATAGTAFSFTVTTTGYPDPTVTASGPLPKGITFDPDTAIFSGTPAEGSTGRYQLTVAASSNAGTATQTFELTVTA
jgi:hypothetical protein